MNTILEEIIDERLLKSLSRKSKYIYRKTTREKKKFGKAQLNEDGSIRYRDTQEPCLELKNLQQKINRFLQTFPLPNVMYGSIRGKDNIRHAAAHSAGSHFFMVDLKNYFSNISNTQVHKTLLSLGFSMSNARIITRLTTFDGHLPQGAPTSPTLANLVFAKTATELSHYCKSKEIVFTNYVDDLVFSANMNFKEFIPEILALIKQNGFFLNHKKIRYRRRYGEVTGLFVKGGLLHLKKEMNDNIGNPGIKNYAERVDDYNEKLKRNVKVENTSIR